MKQIFKYSMMLAVLMMAVFTFTACGSDDKDDLPDGYVETQTGVHRIEVSFSGDTTGWSADLMFTASMGVSPVNIYENGEQVNDSPGGWYTTDIRKYSVETAAQCDMMTLTLGMSSHLNKNLEAVTVTLKGFVNGKQTNMLVKEFTPGGSSERIVFTAENIGADLY